MQSTNYGNHILHVMGNGKEMVEFVSEVTLGDIQKICLERFPNVDPTSLSIRVGEGLYSHYALTASTVRT